MTESTRFSVAFRRLMLGMLIGIATAGTLVLAVCGRPTRSIADPPAENTSPPLDPAAWGNDHVGQPLPEYIEGGECLFCHRSPVGATWGPNKHNRTIRDAEPQSDEMKPLLANPALSKLAEQVQLVMGDTRHVRYLRRSERYGRLEILSVGAARGRGRNFRLTDTKDPHWDLELFNKGCVGCHATATQPEDQAFRTVSHDCYVCHGDATEEHANDPALMPLAKERHDPPRVVISICAQCHVRFGKSRATGLPFPTNFVAGDNLFKDYEVDFSLADDPHLNPADRHVMQNVRDVVIHGKEQTCLDCHAVHPGSTEKHRHVAEGHICLTCHEAGRPKTEHIRYEVHSERCQY